MEKIEDIKKGTFFKRKEISKKVYIRKEYNRSAKAYACVNFDDISDYIYIKKGKLIYTNFEF